MESWDMTGVGNIDNIINSYLMPTENHLWYKQICFGFFAFFPPFPISLCFLFSKSIKLGAISDVWKLIYRQSPTDNVLTYAFLALWWCKTNTHSVETTFQNFEFWSFPGPVIFNMILSWCRVDTVSHSSPSAMRSWG